MPDWFYRTVSRPLLFHLPVHRARNLALGFIGGLARLPFGPAVIDFLGHMRADPRLKQSFLGIDFPTAVGLGPWLDTRAIALPALARFGLGFLEVGPVTVQGTVAERPVQRLAEQQALWFGDVPASLGVTALVRRLTGGRTGEIPVMVRLGCPSAVAWEELRPKSGHTDYPISTPTQSRQRGDDGWQRLIAALAPHAHLLSLSTLPLALAEGWSMERWSTHLRMILDTANTSAPARPVLLCVAPDQALNTIAPLIEAGLTAGIQGLVVDGSIVAQPDGRWLGLPARQPALEQVRGLRRRYGEGLLIIASGGVHEPEHALELRAAGADLVQVDSGLVYTGPGLPKRINDILLFEATRSASLPEPPARPAELTWFWTTLMGAGMLFGSLLALVIAATQVVLPYDEVFVGLSRVQIAAINPRLLAFMTHDRIALAGTMLAIGVMYVGLSVFGVRHGLRWARQSVFISACTGFASFFLFLGFGYLDTFHAFVTGALLQLLLFGFHARLGTYTPAVRPDVRGDWAWQWGLWGQFLLVIHGLALLTAGCVISVIGITQVFVPEDLEFMQTAAEALRTANARLVPLVAHDRATFGGMLLASGWAFLLPSLWGYRNGSSWLWWTFLIAGLAGYSAALGVHYAVGYLSLKHVLPAFGGFGLFLLGLILSYPFLCRKG